LAKPVPDLIFVVVYFIQENLLAKISYNKIVHEKNVQRHGFLQHLPLVTTKKSLHRVVSEDHDPDPTDQKGSGPTVS
jgi:hypothetical protein